MFEIFQKIKKEQHVRTKILIHSIFILKIYIYNFLYMGKFTSTHAFINQYIYSVTGTAYLNGNIIQAFMELILQQRKQTLN